MSVASKVVFPSSLIEILVKRREVRLLRVHNDLKAGRITKPRALERGYDVLEKTQHTEVAQVRRWAKRRKLDSSVSADDPELVKGLEEDKEVWKNIIEDM